MRVWIPMCGDAIGLEADWIFTLHPEYRNSDFAAALKVKGANSNSWGWSNKKTTSHILPYKTELVCDRVYIRQKADEYASVTWIVKSHPTNPDLVGHRFWTKLEEVNQIEAIPLSSGNPVGPIAKAHYRCEALPPDEKAKKEAKRAKAKRNKEEREAVTQALLPYLRKNRQGNIRTQMEMMEEVVHRLAMEGVAQDPCYSMRYNEQQLNEISAHHARRRVESLWQYLDGWHIKSTKRHDGTTTRRFAFQPWDRGGESIAAFDVTTRDSDFDIIHVTPVGK